CESRRRPRANSAPRRHQLDVSALRTLAGLEDRGRDAVMTSGRELCVELPAVDPFDHRLAADANPLRDLRRRVVALAKPQVDVLGDTRERGQRLRLPAAA